MDLIVLKNITKKFQLNNKESFIALNNVSLTLPNYGLIAIIGKSGSGKTTLLNVMAGLDKASSGTYLFNGSDISSYSEKEMELFRNRRVGIIFQHYYLLENETVLFNVALPLLISGTSSSNAYKEAKELLKGIDFNEDYCDKKVKNLSGGEKQRVAILRSLINAPNVLFADEPTGALDSENSKRVMEILRKLSKKRLVVVVSHNKELVERYADRIIQMRDGKIVLDRTEFIKEDVSIPITKVKNRKSNYWVEKISKNNLKRRFFRNLFSIASLSISLVASTLVLGFSSNANEAIKTEGKRRLDYGVISISKEKKSDIEGSFISLVEQSRPSKGEREYLERTNQEFIFFNNYENLLLSGLTVKYEEEELKDIVIRPIYHFDNTSLDKSLLIEGSFPKKKDSFDEILINKKASELIKNNSNYKQNSNSINITGYYESDYYTFDEHNKIIKDIFALDKDFKISGVVDELDFLSIPTIYYSYEGYMKFLSDNLLNNLSEYYSRNITWITRIDEASDNDELSGYSIKGFLKNKSDNIYLKDYITAINDEEITATSLAITVEESLLQLVDASSKGMIVFLFIALLGVVLIIGILSFFSYTEDRKQSAILSSLGASRSSIISIYLFENIMIGLLSYFVSLIFSFPLIKLADFLVNNFTSIKGMVDLPHRLLTSFNYDYFIILLLMMFIIVYFSTYIPIFFSKKISLSKELKDE